MPTKLNNCGPRLGHLFIAGGFSPPQMTTHKKPELSCLQKLNHCGPRLGHIFIAGGFSARFRRPHRTLPRPILFHWKLLGPMLPYGIYPRILTNEQPTKRLSCPAYKIKPQWATSGASFYCWGLLTPSNDNPQKARVVLPTKLNHCGPRLGPVFIAGGFSA